jgi:Putative transposase, YhgA-like
MSALHAVMIIVGMNNCGMLKGHIMSDFDSPWKDALELFFPAFVTFFFPQVHAAVDWSRGYEALDKELQQIVREAAVGRRYADKLFKVWLKDGQEAWVLIHVEVQSQPDEGFTERMFVYHYRLYDRHRRPVVSLAVLADEQLGWRPDKFGYSLCGCTIGLEFPVVKLLDYGGDLEALETGRNPFAPLVLAHLKTLETRQDTAARQGWKMRVIRGLYERGYTGDHVRQLFRLIDWMMDLPEDLEDRFYEELSRFEEEKQMPYVTSIERIALKKGEAKGEAKGKAEGKAETLLRVLERRFATNVPADLDVAIRGTTDLARLERWVDLAFEAGSLDEFRRLGQI